MTREELETLQVTIHTSLEVKRPFYQLYAQHIRDLENLNKDESIEYLQHLFCEMYKQDRITAKDSYDNIGVSIKFKENENQD